MFNVEDNDDDEMYFTPSSSTNLAQLLQASMVQPESQKEVLTYKPPRQPSPKTEPCIRAKHQSTVILFKEVHAFQLINKEYTPAGKCGLALIGNEQLCIYQLLLYKQKNNIISTSKVTINFEFIKQKNNYITIKDDKKLTWTIHFNNESDLDEFTHIISTRCGCKRTKLQDSNSKQTSIVEEGVIKRLEPDNTLMALQDKNERTRESVCKVCKDCKDGKECKENKECKECRTEEETVNSVKERSIYPSKEGSTSNTTESSTKEESMMSSVQEDFVKEEFNPVKEFNPVRAITPVIEVSPNERVREPMKESATKEKPKDITDRPSKMKPPRKSDVLHPCGDALSSNAKHKETSSEYVDSETSESDSKRADILSKVARMGRRVLTQSVHDTSNDSDVEEPKLQNSTKNPPKSKMVIANPIPPENVEQTNILPRSNISSVLPCGTQTVPCQNLPQVQSSVKSFVPVVSDHPYLQLRPSINQMMMPYQDGVLPSPQIVYSASQMSAEQLNMFFVENRTHHSEIRMNILKLQNGLDEVLHLIKKTEDPGAAGTKIAEKFTQTFKYDVPMRCHCPQQTNLIEENKKIVQVLSEKEKALSILRNSYEACKKKNDDLVRKETEHSYEISKLTEETARCTYEEHKLNQKIKEQQTQMYNQAIKLAECEEKLSKLTQAYCDCVHIKKQKLPEIKEKIKERMNIFYNEACGSFKGDGKYDGEHIKKVLASSIIDNTYQIINVIHELFT